MIKINKGYRYRFYPTDEQKQQIEINLNCQRYVWNGFLALKEFRYKEFKESMSYNKMSARLTQIKKCDDFLQKADKWVLQQCLRQLDDSFNRFYKKIGKYPKFKSKRNTKDSYTTVPSIKEDFIKIPKIGELNIKYSRRLEVDKVGMCTISKKNNKYYISFNVIVTKTKYNKTGKDVGIDLGLKTFAYTSDNEQFNIPKKLWSLESRLEKQQRKLSKKPSRDSKRYNTQKLYVAELHERIANLRNDFQHKLSTNLVKRYDRISIEDLNIKGMMSNRRLSRAIGRCSFYQFRTFLEYKCKEHDKELLVINRWFPSSKTCSCCGNIKEDLTLKDRVYKCNNCGTVLDRYYNASININREGTRNSLVNLTSMEVITQESPCFS